MLDVKRRNGEKDRENSNVSALPLLTCFLLTYSFFTRPNLFGEHMFLELTMQTFFFSHFVQSLISGTFLCFVPGSEETFHRSHQGQHR